MQVLRDYQIRADQGVRAAFRAGHRRVLLVMSTGAGKTTTFAHWLMGAVGKGSTAIVLAHRRELISQASKRLSEHFVPHGIILAGTRSDSHQPVQVASVQSLIPRLYPKDPEMAAPPPPANIIICDEAHHASAASFRKVFSQYPDAYILGCTATPARTDGKGLRDLFDVMVEVISTAELIELGYLCDYVIYEGEYAAPDEDLAVIGGDFDQAEAANRIDTDTLVGEVYDNWKRRANGKPTIIFAQTRKHGKHLLDVFRAHGEMFEYIDDQTKKDERDRILTGYANGTVPGVINVGILTEGYDAPRTECVVISRMTASLILWLQMCGRGLRPWAGKSHLIILDHGGNARHRFGGPDFPHEWSLDGRKKREQPIQPSLTTCPVCRAIVRSTTRVCKECGHILVYVSKGPDVPDTTPGMLVEANYKIRGSERDEKKREAELAKLEQEKKRAEREAKKLEKAREVERKAAEMEAQKDFLVKMVDEMVRWNYPFKRPLTRFRERFVSAEKPKGFFPNHKHGVFIYYKKEWKRNKEGALELKQSIRGWTLNGKEFGDVPKAQ